MSDSNEKKIPLKQKIFHEMKMYWINVLYLAIFFGVFTHYRRLILAHHHIAYGEYGISVVKALILGKVILILETLRFGRGLENKPLIIPTFYKSFLFTFSVVIFNVIEAAIRGLLLHKGMAGVFEQVVKLFSYEWLAGTMVVFFAFIPFFVVRELDRVLGEGKIFDLFFISRGRKN